MINFAPRKLGDLQEKLVIQHSAMCGGGTSGGPLINANGQLMGVHILRNAGRAATGTSFGFAAPITDFYHLYDQFKQATCRFELGIMVTEDSNEREGKHLVVTNSTRGDIRKGDKILEIVGRSKDDYTTLEGALKEHIQKGEPFEVKISRFKEMTADKKQMLFQVAKLKVKPMLKSKRL